MNEYYYLDARSVPQGPHTLDALALMMASGKVNPTTLVAFKGGTSWEPLGSVLSRENIEAPQVQVEVGQVGSCPRCGLELSDHLVEGLLPARCPRCTRALRAETSSIWSNFCLAIRNYAEFSGRATRKEFWSFTLIVILGYIACLGLMVAGFITMAVQMNEGGDAFVERLNNAEGDAETLNVLMESGAAAGVSFLLSMTSVALLILWFFFTLVPCFSIMYRRLHDIGKSGWWYGGYLIASLITPFLSLLLQDSVGTLIDTGMFAYYLLLFVFCLMNSQRGANKYGASPKYPLG